MKGVHKTEAHHFDSRNLFDVVPITTGSPTMSGHDHQFGCPIVSELQWRAIDVTGKPLTITRVKLDCRLDRSRD
jgi:hypothetical protein